jgi:hypothetical protein
MGRWTKESHGFSILRPIAEKLLLDSQKKKRIWSEKYEAWGFYCDDSTQEDEFLFWSLIEVGDRVHLQSTIGHDCESSGIALIIDIKKDAGDGLFRKAKLLLNTGRLIELSIEENKVFKWAWKYIF